MAIVVTVDGLGGEGFQWNFVLRELHEIEAKRIPLFREISDPCHFAGSYLWPWNILRYTYTRYNTPNSKGGHVALKSASPQVFCCAATHT